MLSFHFSSLLRCKLTLNGNAFRNCWWRIIVVCFVLSFYRLCQLYSKIWLFVISAFLMKSNTVQRFATGRIRWRWQMHWLVLSCIADTGDWDCINFWKTFHSLVDNCKIKKWRINMNCFICKLMRLYTFIYFQLKSLLIHTRWQFWKFEHRNS